MEQPKGKFREPMIFELQGGHAGGHEGGHADGHPVGHVGARSDLKNNLVQF